MYLPFQKINKSMEHLLKVLEDFKSEKISSLFSIQSYGSWKIEKASPGGVAVYVCTNESEDITIYIDRGTKLPLKIIRKGTEADIISFEATTQ